MAGIKLNAREVIIEISDGATTPVWTEIEGLNSLTFNPSENEEMTETTDFQSQGNYEGEKMQKGATLECEGFLIKDSVTGAQAPGQAQVEELHELLGPASQGTIRFRHPLDTSWKRWTAVVTLGEQGGENNDKTSWGATFTRSGASTDVVVAP